MNLTHISVFRTMKIKIGISYVNYRIWHWKGVESNTNREIQISYEHESI